MAYSHIQTSKLSNEELHRVGPDELIHRLRKADQERIKVIKEHGQLMKDVNQRMQVHLVEIRSLKDVNHRLQEDNQELRGLCCFLDDERQKACKLTKEWQRFGRYTSGVMKSEVSIYQQKLKELETRQEELLAENDELKQLCMYLEQCRGSGRDSAAVDRDQGDGSSNSSTTTEKVPSQEQSPVSSMSKHAAVLNGVEPNQYIRQLEDKIFQMEEERKHTSKRSSRERPTSPVRNEHHRFFTSPRLPDSPSNSKLRSVPTTQDRSHSAGRLHQTAPTQNAESVDDAMKVLEIHEKLERPHRDLYEEDEMEPMQKALVQEMCNVVWRKIGDAVPGYKTPV